MTRFYAYSSSAGGCSGIPLDYALSMSDLPAPDEPLGKALHFSRMSGTFCRGSGFTAPWALELLTFEQCLMFLRGAPSFGRPPACRA